MGTIDEEILKMRETIEVTLSELTGTSADLGLVYPTTVTAGTVEISEMTELPKRKYTKKAKMMPPPEAVKIASIINNGYITLNDYFKVDVGVHKILKRNIEKGVSTMLLGATGIGKTELVNNVAKELKLPITIFDMGTMTDPIMSLVGTHVIKVNDGHTSSEFVKSRFSQVIQEPGIVLLDEISR